MVLAASEFVARVAVKIASSGFADIAMVESNAVIGHPRALSVA